MRSRQRISPLITQIERAAIEEFVDALGHHAGAVECARPARPSSSSLSAAALDPVLQVLDGIEPTQSLSRCRGIHITSSFAASIVRILAPSATCAPTSARDLAPQTAVGGASSACSIFIASTTATRSPLVTLRARRDQDRQHLAVHRGLDDAVAVEVIDIDRVIALQRDVTLHAMPTATTPPATRARSARPRAPPQRHRR